MRTLLCTLALTAALLGGALAVTVTPQIDGDTLRLAADGNIRFTVDPYTGAVSIDDATFAPNSILPVGVKWQQRGKNLVILPDRASQISLSPDGTQLVLTHAATTAVPALTALGSLKDDAGKPLAPIFIPLANADPQSVAGILTNLYTNIRVQVDARQRAVLVLTSPENQAVITQVVKTLDQGRPQVALEAELLEVNRSLSQNIGIDYDNLITFKFGETPGKNGLSVGKITRGGFSLGVGIDLLKQNGAAKILARPRVTTLDGMEAKINSTQTTPVVTTTTTTSTVQSITTGITLRITPRVAPDGTVEATLDILVSTPTGVTDSGLPQFASREASTTVRVANGEPIAIGGLLESRTLTSQNKVPILGDLPLIGALFTKTQTQTQDTDLVIVVTPRIIDPTDR